MLIRIVKLTFKKDTVADFKQIFNQINHKVRGFEGCSFLELYQDKENPTIFFTYSYWENETVLENYLKSVLFKKVWGNIKILFAAKPEAWSVSRV